MRYLSVCSGIEAATVAWRPLGWQAVAFAEIDPFASAILAQHYPETPNLGDMTRYEEWPDVGAVDVLVGGTPCQSFSVAGRRGGMDDPRGLLAFVLLGIARRFRPRWIVFENVPGLLSSGGGRDFGSILREMAKLGYGSAYRVLDAQFFGVPQRRRRVFVIGHLADWRRAAAVLFESPRLRGDLAADKSTPEATARPFDGCSKHGRPKGSGRRAQDAHRPVISPPVVGCSGRETRRPGAQADDADGLVIAPTASETGSRAVAPLLLGHWEHLELPGAAGCLQERDAKGADSDTKPGHLLPTFCGVRRLTPRECERLQGFPDDYTRIPWRGKTPENCPDGPRYRVIGNSMAVPVMRWLGERIHMVGTITGDA